MKKLIAVLVLGTIVFACGAPKVAVTAMQPDPVQVPVKIASPAEDGPKPLAFALEEGKSLYENDCAKCHGLYKPTDFTREEWGPIMAKMQIKARITDEETASIYNYILSGLQ
ncbi:MAG TPA: cytochrome c [Flavobacterium sp.]|nr:cytochrome c [Flavobacterium sp.]